MAAFAALLLLGRARLGRLFSSDDAVALLTAQAVPPLAVSLVGEGANTVLSGIMRGCGRQRIGATVNLVRVCICVFGGCFGVCGVFCFGRGEIF
jgi:MATE family multidrug resistance protein